MGINFKQVLKVQRCLGSNSERCQVPGTPTEVLGQSHTARIQSFSVTGSRTHIQSTFCFPIQCHPVFGDILQQLDSED